MYIIIVYTFIIMITLKKNLKVNHILHFIISIMTHAVLVQLAG